MIKVSESPGKKRGGSRLPSQFYITHSERFFLCRQAGWGLHNLCVNLGFYEKLLFSRRADTLCSVQEASYASFKRTISNLLFGFVSVERVEGSKRGWFLDLLAKKEKGGWVDRDGNGFLHLIGGCLLWGIVAGSGVEPRCIEALCAAALVGSSPLHI